MSFVRILYLCRFQYLQQARREPQNAICDTSQNDRQIEFFNRLLGRIRMIVLRS
jgi:hypothetical protein